MRYLSGFIIGILLALVIIPYVTFYKSSCDVTRFGPMWQSQAQLAEYQGFQCLNSNHILVLEQDPEVIFKLIKLNIKYVLTTVSN
jgi:hypothetical protein